MRINEGGFKTGKKLPEKRSHLISWDLFFVFPGPIDGQICRLIKVWFKIVYDVIFSPLPVTSFGFQTGGVIYRCWIAGKEADGDKKMSYWIQFRIYSIKEWFSIEDKGPDVQIPK